MSSTVLNVPILISLMNHFILTFLEIRNRHANHTGLKFNRVLDLQQLSCPSLWSAGITRELSIVSGCLECWLVPSCPTVSVALPFLGHTAFGPAFRAWLVGVTNGHHSFFHPTAQTFAVNHATCFSFSLLGCTHICRVLSMFNLPSDLAITPVP